MTFNEYAQATVEFKLHDWQAHHLGPALEEFALCTGIRLLIHAPPQFGKSTLVSERLPAYCLGTNPLSRVVLCAFNSSHAEDFAETVIDLMRSPEFTAAFPRCQLARKNPLKKHFRTLARKELRSSQWSFMARGLLGGITGKGGDKWIFDDPYKSHDEAESEAINGRVKRFWTKTVKPRLNDDASVLWMFHRYHEGDIAGELLAEGGWRYLRFPAEADENEDGSDPTGREPGELLSPMRTKEFLAELRERDPQMYLGQFQGRPRAADGGLIKRHYLKVGLAPACDIWVRFWDLASGKKQRGDYFAGALCCVGADQTLYIKDVVRMRGEWPEVCETITMIAERDAAEAARSGSRYYVGVEQVAWQLPMIQDLFTRATFERIQLWPIKPVGDKKERASGWIARAAHDRLRMEPGAWHNDFVNEGLAFDGLGTVHDDQIDAVSGAYTLIWDIRGGTNEQERPVRQGTIEHYDRLAGIDSSDDSGWD